MDASINTLLRDTFLKILNDYGVAIDKVDVSWTDVSSTVTPLLLIRGVEFHAAAIDYKE